MSSAQGSAVSVGVRALAWLSIGCAAVLTVVLVIFSVRNLAALVTIVVGVALAGAGGWWLITERPPRRWIGVGGVVVGVVVVVAAVLAAADGDRPLVRAAVVLVLFVVTIGSARLAMVRRLHAQDALQPHEVTPSTSSCADLQPVVGRWKGRPVRSRRTGQRARCRDGDARSWTRPRAARPRRHRPGSGLPRDGGWRRLPGPRGIDRGRVRGPVRLCHRPGHGTTSPKTSASTATTLATASTPSATPSSGGSTTPRSTIGSSSTTSRSASTRRSCSRTATATRRWRRPRRCCRICSATPRTPSISNSPTPDGTEIDGAFVIQVSNNPYVLGSSFDAGQRRRIDTGQLGVIALTGTHRAETPPHSSPSARSDDETAAATGTSSPAPSFEVRSRSGTAFAGVDGEALEMTTPSMFRIHPRGLRLLVPRGKHRSRTPTPRPQRQPPRPARCRKGATMMAPTSTREPRAPWFDVRHTAPATTVVTDDCAGAAHEVTGRAVMRRMRCRTG